MLGIFRATGRHGPERLTAGTRVLGVAPITAHCYRVGATLIDAGPPNRAQVLLEHLGPDAIKHVLLTHHHEDHVGAAAELSRRGVPVQAPEATLAWLSDGVKVTPYRRWTWGTPEPIEARPLDEVTTTPDGRFQAIPTPGHAPEHVALFEQERGWLFSGDAYLGKRKELRSKEDLVAMVASLERMRKLDAERLFPGHGPAVRDPDARLAEAIAFYEELAEQARTLADAGASTPAIRRELLGPEPFVRYFSGGDFKRHHLAEQLLDLAARG